jgi:hypothetical protein
MQMSLESRAWYIDRFGMERECIVVKVSGLVDMILAVTDLEGKPLDVPHGDLYYVPRHAKEDE